MTPKQLLENEAQTDEAIATDLDISHRVIEMPRLWLRWCDREGQVIPTGAEGQAAERQRADA